MIADALKFITNELDEYLRMKTSEKNTLVKLSGLATSGGEISLSINSTLIISLVNIEQETNLSNKSQISSQQAGMIKQSSPVYLNLYILITSVFKENEYAQGLHWLSLAIGFFQQHPSFTSDQHQMPQNIERLNFELVNSDLDSMSRFWGALGASYQPSVIYKMRMLKIEASPNEEILPKISVPVR